MRTRRTAVMVLDRCAGEIPELAAVWFGEARYALVDLWADYLELRSRHSPSTSTGRSLPARSSKHSRPGPIKMPWDPGTTPLPGRHRHRMRRDDPPPPDRQHHDDHEIPRRPGAIARYRSRQSGLPTGLLGRFFGRAMESATAPANNRALAALDLSQPRTILEVGFGQGRTVAELVDAATASSASTPHQPWSPKPPPATAPHVGTVASRCSTATGPPSRSPMTAPTRRSPSTPSTSCPTPQRPSPISPASCDPAAPS